MKNIRYFFALLLFVFLVACSSEPVPTPEPTPTPETNPEPEPTPGETPEPETSTEADFATYLQELNADWQSVIGESDEGPSYLNALPANTLLTDLSSLTDLISMEDTKTALEQFSSFAFLSLYQLIPTHQSDVSLPVGYYDYDLESQSWMFIKDSEDLSLEFIIKDTDDSDIKIVLTFDWNYGAPTTTVLDRTGRSIEVPDIMRISVTKNDTAIGYLDLDAEWCEGCGEDIFELSKLTVKGQFGYEGSPDKIDIDVYYKFTDNGGDEKDTIKTTGDILYTSGEDRAHLTWDILDQGYLYRDENCFLTVIAIDQGDVNIKLDLALDGKERLIELALSHGQVIADEKGYAIYDISGDVKADSQQVLSFMGTFNDSNGNGVPGEELEINFKNGEMTTLEAILNEYLKLP